MRVTILFDEHYLKSLYITYGYGILRFLMRSKVELTYKIITIVNATYNMVKYRFGLINLMYFCNCGTLLNHKLCKVAVVFWLCLKLNLSSGVVKGLFSNSGENCVGEESLVV